MIDEETLMRRYMDSAPAPSDAELEFARRALDEAIEQDLVHPGHRLGSGRSTDLTARHWHPSGRVIGTVAAAVVVVITVLVVVAGGGKATPPSKLRPVSHPPGWHLAGYTSQGIWAVEPSTGADSYHLACPTASTCYASGPIRAPRVGSQTAATDVIEVTHDGGKTWTVSLSPPGGVQLVGLTCPGVSNCMVVDQDFVADTVSLLTTTDGGTTWTSVPIGPAPGLGSLALSCGTTSDCVVTEANPGPGGTGEQDVAYVTSDGGSEWTEVSLPGYFRVSTLQCVPGGRCIAGGLSPPTFDVTNPHTLQDTASVIFSTDGGYSWSTGVLPVSGTLVSPVSCIDSEHCLAIETRTSTPIVLVATDNGGRTWTQVSTNLPAAAGVNAIACPSSQECWMTGSSGPSTPTTGIDFGQPAIFFTNDGGHSWSSEALPAVKGAALRSVRRVTCPTTTNCFALGNVPLSAPTHPEGQEIVLSYTATPAPTAGSS
jgi:photosystem II stability/assembly factor-like uncharacterized protein